MSEQEKKDFKALCMYLMHDISGGTSMVSYWSKVLAEGTEDNPDKVKALKYILNSNQRIKDIQDYFYKTVKERNMI